MEVNTPDSFDKCIKPHRGLEVMATRFSFLDAPRPLNMVLSFPVFAGFMIAFGPVQTHAFNQNSNNNVRFCSPFIMFASH